MHRFIGVLIISSILMGCASTASAPTPIPSVRPAPPATPTFDPIARIQAAFTTPGNEYAPVTGFPAQPQTVACALPMYTPLQPDGTSGGTTIPASCTTSVQADADHWIVRFTETWDSGIFRSVGDTGRGSFQHTWEFTLDHQGTIQTRRHFGQFPPQYVHSPFDPPQTPRP
jgi:hypothetical protein